MYPSGSRNSSIILITVSETDCHEISPKYSSSILPEGAQRWLDQPALMINIDFYPDPSGRLANLYILFSLIVSFELSVRV